MAFFLAHARQNPALGPRRWELGRVCGKGAGVIPAPHPGSPDGGSPLRTTQGPTVLRGLGVSQESYQVKGGCSSGSILQSGISWKEHPSHNMRSLSGFDAFSTQGVKRLANGDGGHFWGE